MSLMSAGVCGASGQKQTHIPITILKSVYKSVDVFHLEGIIPEHVPSFGAQGRFIVDKDGFSV